LLLYDVQTQERSLFCASFDVQNDIYTRPEGVYANLQFCTINASILIMSYHVPHTLVVIHMAYDADKKMDRLDASRLDSARRKKWPLHPRLDSARREKLCTRFHQTKRSSFHLARQTISGKLSRIARACVIDAFYHTTFVCFYMTFRHKKVVYFVLALMSKMTYIHDRREYTLTFSFVQSTPQS
jgi:hypothetical protein